MGRSAAAGGKVTGALALAMVAALPSAEALARGREGGESPAAREDFLFWPPPPLEPRGAPPPEVPPFPAAPRIAPDLLPPADLSLLDDLLAMPRRVMDGALDLLSRRVPDPADALWDGREGDAPLLLRLLRVRVAGGEEDLFRNFLDEWLDRQRGYLAGLQEKTLRLEDDFVEPEALEPGRFFRKQRKLAWNALKSVYLDRYQVEARETLRRTNFGAEEWHGIDYAILPPAIAAYVAYRGFDQRFSLGPLRLAARMEPLAEWYRLRQDLTAGLTLECRPKDFPLALLLAVGVHDGDVELDFIGIGTGTGAMLQALHAAEDR